MNLKQLAIAGIIGAGSLGIFGNNGYGQTLLDGRYLSKEEIESDSILPKGYVQVKIMDLNKDKKIDYIIYEYKSNEKKDSLNVEFIDKDYNGSLESQTTHIFDKEGNEKTTEYQYTSPNKLKKLKIWETFGVGKYSID